jgi:hypothetical protein
MRAEKKVPGVGAPGCVERPREIRRNNMRKVAPPHRLVHRPLSERQRHRRSKLSSLKKYRLDQWLTVHPVWEVDDE